jgi:phage terminase large subunit
MSKLKVQVSSVFTKLRLALTRIVIMEGSSRSTKTYSIIQYILKEHMAQQGLVTTISRKRLTWIKGTVLVDFFHIATTQFGLPGRESDSWNKSEMVYKINGGEVSFIGLDEAQKLHGRKQDIAWINEAVEAEKKDFNQLVIRTKKKIILDYNPSYEHHWIYDSVQTRDDATFIKSTYLDNPFLSNDIKDEIERFKPTPDNIRQGTADEVNWKIYGLGERAAHRGLIFGSAEICKELPPESEWKRVFYGLDFGFTNDPTAITQIVEAHGNLYCKQLTYKRGLTNRVHENNPNQDSIEQHLINHKIPKSAIIWADSAEPKSIADLQNAGWKSLKGADKGQDSIKAGIDTMKRFKIFITEDSVDAIKEKNNYKWREDSSGNATNTPIDAWNHFWDSVRYPVFMEFRNQIPTMVLVSVTGESKWLGR